jgi:hypothetical protein
MDLLLAARLYDAAPAALQRFTPERWLLSQLIGIRIILISPKTVSSLDRLTSFEPRRYINEVLVEGHGEYERPEVSVLIGDFFVIIFC